MTMTRSRTAVAFTAVVSALIVALAVLRISAAGFDANTDNGSGWESGRIVLTDDDSDSALFNSSVTGLLDGGQSQTRCIAVTYSGTLTSNVAIRAYATATSGALAPYLNLSVEEGTGGGAGTCTGFTPTAALYTGTLAEYASTYSSYATGAGDWAVTGTPETRTYRFTTTVQNVPAAQSATATARFVWTAAVAPFTPAALSDKALWVRAKDLGSAGSSVATWPDLSGRLTPMTLNGTAPTVAAASTPSGGKSVLFTGAGSLRMGDVFNTGTRATSDFVSSSIPRNAVDGDPNTYWVAGQIASGPRPLRLAPPRPVAATAYTITPRPASDSAAGNDPRTWTFEGSNDGQAWTVLDTRVDQAFPATTPATPRTFTFGNTTKYAAYRIVITQTSNGYTWGQPAISEFAIDGVTDKYVPAPQGEAWVVIRSDGGGAWGHYGSSTGTASLAAGTSGLYDSFGAASSQSYTSPTPMSGWHLLRLTTNGTVWAAAVDGITTRTVNAVPVAWHYNNNLGNGAATLPAQFKGNIAEALLRTKVSTPAEAAKITAYFNAEHGLAAVAP